MSTNFVLNKTNVKKINVVQNGVTTAIKKVIDKAGNVLWNAVPTVPFYMNSNLSDGTINFTMQPNEYDTGDYTVYFRIWYTYNTGKDSYATTEVGTKVGNITKLTTRTLSTSLKQEGYCLCTKARLSVVNNGDSEDETEAYTIYSNTQLGIPVTNPPLSTDYTYDGKEHYAVSANTSYYSRSGSGTNHGTYTTTCSLKDSNMYWATGGHRAAATRAFTISQAEFSEVTTQFASSSVSGGKYTVQFIVYVSTSVTSATDTVSVTLTSCYYGGTNVLSKLSTTKQTANLSNGCASMCFTITGLSEDKSSAPTIRGSADGANFCKYNF